MNTRKKLLIAAIMLGAVIHLAAGSAVELPRPDPMGAPERGPNNPYDYGVMGPPATPAIVADSLKAVTTPLPKGPFEASWPSIAQNYQAPEWFMQAKFGIFMHWGVYSAAARRNEWYEKHMYGAESNWHIENFGPQETAGYKNLIALFTADKWDPAAWAALFKKSGAKFVMPTAQHHDNFALWDSRVTPYNSVRMGPKRDLVGDLGKAVRAAGMKYGVSNHGIENFTFINPPNALNDRLKAAHADLYDPEWAPFYNVADRSPAAMTRFLADWVNRNVELIDKYQPDILWFDNGANLRVLDPLKLYVAAYYYNRAATWGKQVSISTKYNAYAPSNDDTKQIGSIIDFEKVGARSPAGIRPAPWLVDDAIGSTWGYTTGMTVASAGTILNRLIDTVSKDGTYLLNISPMADGTIPQNQQDVLLAIGRWLDINGEAIYGSRAWTKFGEGQGRGAWRFTRNGDTLFAIVQQWPGSEAVIASLATGDAPAGKIEKVELLGHTEPLPFTQDATGLKIKLPATPSGELAWTFKITGLKLGPPPPLAGDR